MNEISPGTPSVTGKYFSTCTLSLELVFMFSMISGTWFHVLYDFNLSTILNTPQNFSHKIGLISDCACQIQIAFVSIFIYCQTVDKEKISLTVDIAWYVTNSFISLSFLQFSLQKSTKRLKAAITKCLYCKIRTTQYKFCIVRFFPGPKNRTTCNSEIQAT